MRGDVTQPVLHYDVRTSLAKIVDSRPTRFASGLVNL